MLLSVDVESKSIGNKVLFENLKFTIEAKEKVAVIGRNGVGKTTLFQMIAGKDTDYSGEIRLQRGAVVVSTAQEHHDVAGESVIEYVLNNLPEYRQLKYIIDTHPNHMGDNIKKIEAYSNALERFNDLNYYNVGDEVLQSLENYQITREMAEGSMSKLSGGQKRFVELVRVEHAGAQIALIDEPTNHMDYVAKGAFIDWFESVNQAVLVITHDRDVLRRVDKIIEIKDKQAQVFKGNYEAYLKQNTLTTVAKINDYEIALRTLDNLHKKILWARAKKPAWSGTADKKNPFEVMERRLQKQYDEIENNMQKPNFWIDQESAEGLSEKASENYGKFKAKNIQLHKTQEDKHSSELLHVENLQLGYGGKPLFSSISFNLSHGERLHLIGRNGAGKTTIVKAVVEASKDGKPATLMDGSIICGNKLRLSVYEQELDATTMQMTLAEAIEHIYDNLGLEVSREIIMKTLSNYLFDPTQDDKLRIEQLSGGQKARLQIIKMLAGNPNLLILDEPTNHLDLPSIEELENALQNYQGALLYVSHDSYFAKNIGGEELKLQK